jgi:hypothetical protein
VGGGGRGGWGDKGVRVCGETSGLGGHVKRLKTTDLGLRGQEKQRARVFSFVIYV